MAECVAIATGVLTAAGTWGVTGTGTMTSSNTGSTALTTGNLDSSAFAPGAVTAIGVCVRVAARAAGSPTNTMTITLRNSSAGADVIAVTVNVSDLPAATVGTDSEGGWIFLKFSAPTLLIVATNYVIRATLSATTTAVSLATDGTANNWQRLLVLDTTAAPGAGDNMHVVGTFDGSTSPATVVPITVTMDQTVATDYGDAATSAYVSALQISKNGTLTWGTTAATAYLLRLSGHLKVYSGGLYNQGTVATPIPRDSTAQLEFDCAADNAFFFSVMNGGTAILQGLSRTVGKIIEQTLLTANLAAAGIQSTVADDTGWLSGDEIGIAPTTRTSTNMDTVALSGNAGASTLDHAGVTFAHLGTAASLHQAEVVLLTRNCIVKSVSTTSMTSMRILPAGIVDADWVLFRYVGSGTTTPAAIQMETTTGTVNFAYCVTRDSDGSAWRCNAATLAGGTITLSHCVAFRWGVVSTSYGLSLNQVSPTATGTISIDLCTFIGGGGGASVGIQWNGDGDGKTTQIGTVRIAGCPSHGMLFLATKTDCLGTKIGPIHTHSNASAGIAFSTSVKNLRFNDVYAWRNGTSGIQFIAEIAASGLAAVFGSIWFEGILAAFANTTAGLNVLGAVHDLRIADLRVHGDSGFAQAYGMRLVGPMSGRVEKADFSTAAGLLVANATADVGTATPGPGHVDLIINNALLAGTEIDTALAITGATGGYTLGSRISYTRHDRVATEHRTLTPLGDLTYETTTVDITPSLKLTPKHATLKLQSNAQQRGRGFLVPVLSGLSVTVTVQVQKDGSYAGDAPRLLVLANPSVNVAETVLDTHTAASGSFETLTGTIGPTTDTGVLEFCVDCNGVAGNVFLDSWTAVAA